MFREYRHVKWPLFSMDVKTPLSRLGAQGSILELFTLCVCLCVFVCLGVM